MLWSEKWVSPIEHAAIAPVKGPGEKCGPPSDRLKLTALLSSAQYSDVHQAAGWLRLVASVASRAKVRLLATWFGFYPMWSVASLTCIRLQWRLSIKAW